MCRYALTREKQCSGAVEAATCDAVTGCEFWSERCRINCQRLATADACVVSEGCSWDADKRHCYWKVPDCTAITAVTHCTATKLCAYNATVVGAVQAEFS